MRDLYMKTGQGFLLVFSITSGSSLGELAQLRDEIIRIKDDENVPIVIVGNKADLEDQRAVPRARAFSISQQWGAPYYEASARTKSESPPPGPKRTFPSGLLLNGPPCRGTLGVVGRNNASSSWGTTNPRGAGNVDEVFIDLCRQMLRKDDLSDDMLDDRDYKTDHVSKMGRRSRRRRKKTEGGARCIIL